LTHGNDASPKALGNEENHPAPAAAEFDFRYNHRSALGVEDEARTHAAIRGAPGKRLTYHLPD
jgi:hypothetical protein